jgi:hypothetical protein
MANDLLAEPNEAQRRLLEIIWDVYADKGTWPIFDWVETHLSRERGRPDAKEVMLSCPLVPFPAGHGGYGWVRVDNASMHTVQPANPIGLTVVGMSRIREVTRQPRAMQEVNLFIDALGVLVRCERTRDPSPFHVTEVKVSATELQKSLLPPRPGVPVGPDDLTRLGKMLSREPSTWHYVQDPSAGEEWVATLKSSIRDFDGVQDAEQYADRLSAWISPPQPAPPPVLVSSLALPEAIDYLNTVWREWATEPLFLIQRAEAAAKLAYECRTEDEFDSRLTALYGIFCATRLPGRKKNGKPADLEAYLSKHVPLDGRDRAVAAVKELEDFLSLRASRQHPDADERGVRAMRNLGVQLPTDDWGQAWRTIQARMVLALNALREQIEVLDTPSRRNTRSGVPGASPGD